MLTETELLARLWPERYAPAERPYLAAGAPPPAAAYDADIIILTMGRLSATLAAIDSAMHQQGVTAHISVLDQGSPPEMQRACIRRFEGCAQVGYYVAPKNLGVAGGRNFLTDIGHGKIIVAIDNDAVFADAFVALDALRRFTEAPMLGAIAFCILDETGETLDEHSWGYPAALPTQASGRFLTTTFIGAGHAILRAAWEHAGGYDEKLFFTWEEYDFALRAIAAGWQIEYCGDLSVLHRLEQESRVRWQGGRTQLYVRNRLHIARKWGAGWVALAPRVAGYLVKGALNGSFKDAARGIAAAARMNESARRKMPAAMRRYVWEHEDRHRGSFWRRLGPELLRRRFDQPVRGVKVGPAAGRAAGGRAEAGRASG
jgi:GT2 family glycosyltransferase